MLTVFRFWLSHRTELATLLGQHVLLVVVSTLVALPVPLLGGVGARAAIVVLILYGLLPILRTTIAGLNGIDPAIREAGVAMGMKPGELLRQVELPLAVPSIVAGVRVA